MSETAPKYLQPYRMAQRIHGPDFRTTLWNNRDSQRIRFRVLAEIFPLAGRRILDAGCGMGDLLAYLEEMGQPPAAYVGIDALDGVIEQARGRTFRTPAQFRLGDLVADPALLRIGDPEVVVISGTLNTLDKKPFFRTLDAAFAAARSALLFNFLSTRHRKTSSGDDVIRRYDPVEVLAHGLDLTRDVIVRHDYYDGHDCTMAWLKEPRSRHD